MDITDGGMRTRPTDDQFFGVLIFNLVMQVFGINGCWVANNLCSGVEVACILTEVIVTAGDFPYPFADMLHVGVSL